jgi:hypothetical protein
MHETAPRPVTRRRARRGQRVEARFSDGDRQIG